MKRTGFLCVLLVVVLLLPITGCVFDSVGGIAMNPEAAGAWAQLRLDQVEGRVDQAEVLVAQWAVIADQLIGRISS